jgi:hypothetical protein
MTDLEKCPICGRESMEYHVHTTSPNDAGRCNEIFMLKVGGGGLVGSRCLKRAGHGLSKKGHGDQVHKARKPGGVVRWK